MPFLGGVLLLLLLLLLLLDAIIIIIVVVIITDKDAEASRTFSKDRQRVSGQA